MVLTAIVKDLTEPVSIIDMTGDEILELQKDHEKALKRDRRIFFCPECRSALYLQHRKIIDLWLFCHWPGTGHDCSIRASESDGHIFLKTYYCNAARAVPGFVAVVEQKVDIVDPETGRAAVVDVMASRTDGTDHYGFEIQLSAMSEGTAENRHERRLESSMQSCSWVTVTRPTWADRIPWSQVSKTSIAKQCVVVDGVARFQRGSEWGQGNVVRVEPFPAKTMVRSQLLHKMLWTPTMGWTWPDSLLANPRPQRPARANSTAAQRAQKWCDRDDMTPEWAANWTDDDWQVQAHEAHSVFTMRNRKLELIDDLALGRWPNAADLDPLTDLLARGARGAMPVRQASLWSHHEYELRGGFWQRDEF